MKTIGIFSKPGNEILYGWPILQNKGIEKLLLFVTANDEQLKLLDENKEIFGFNYLILNNSSSDSNELQINNHIKTYDTPCVFCETTLSQKLPNIDIDFVIEFEKGSVENKDFYKGGIDNKDFLCPVIMTNEFKMLTKTALCDNGFIYISRKKHKLHRKHVIDLLSALMLGNNIIGAELGVFKGETTAYLATCKHIKKLYAIDAFSSDAQLKRHDSCIREEFPKTNSMGPGLQISSWEELYDFTKNRLYCFKNVELIKLKTHEAALKIQDKLDFVFVDAGHDYVNALRDITTYMPLLSSGGLIIGHDYTQYMPDVQQVVNDYFGDEANKSKFNPIYTKSRCHNANRCDDAVWWLQKL